MGLKVLTVIGTRPEAIKMAPVLQKLQGTSVDSRICVTAQHRSMLDQVMSFFGLTADYDLDVMEINQSLEALTSKILMLLEPILNDFAPDIVLVHGDTTTTFSASLAAFYKQIPVGHVEAGLRTGNVYSPWPEEANRKLTSVMASMHFAPTEQARNNLLEEGISDSRIFVTGNTVIDALLMTKKKLTQSVRRKFDEQFSYLEPERRLVLITGHRRESFGQPFEEICKAISDLARQFEDVDFVYPVHLNPNVQDPVRRRLGRQENIYLLEPLDYFPFVYLLDRSHLVLTDSGGIQEEAPSLGKPVLVMRETTERPEGIDAGTVVLVGSSKTKIEEGVSKLLTCDVAYEEMRAAHNPYGDGFASDRIRDVLVQL